MLTDRENATLDKIVNYTCNYFGIERGELFSSSRKANLVDARCVYAHVASEYIKTVSTIAKYIDKERSVYYNWMERDKNGDVNQGIQCVRFAMKGTMEVIEKIDRYFSLKESIVTLEKEIREKEVELSKRETELQELENIITVDEIYKLW